MTCKRAVASIRGVGTGMDVSRLPSDVSDHLAECADCAAILRDEQALTQALRSGAGSVRPSSGLNARLDTAIREAAQPGRPAWLTHAAAGAATVMLCVMGAWGWFSSLSQEPVGSPTPITAAPDTAVVETAAALAEPAEATDIDSLTVAEPASAASTPTPTVRRVALEIPAAPLFTTRSVSKPDDVSNHARVERVIADGGWGGAPAGDFAPTDWPSEDVGLALDIPSSALATDVGMDGISIDSGMSATTTLEGGPGLSLDVPVTSIIHTDLELEVDSP